MMMMMMMICWLCLSQHTCMFVVCFSRVTDALVSDVYAVVTAMAWALSVTYLLIVKTFLLLLSYYRYISFIRQVNK